MPFSTFGCTAYCRVAVKKWKFYVRRRKYRGPIMMMVLFRIGLATFYIGFLLNIFFSHWSLSLQSLPFLLSFPKKLQSIH
jgi:CPA2 family monovalent cation:H+ antiporter-2